MPQDVEDVAMQACQAIIPKVFEVKDVEELRPLAAFIAYCRAMDRFRRYYGPEDGNKTGPPPDDFDNAGPDGGVLQPSDEVHEMDLAKLIGRILARIKPDAKKLLIDAFHHDKSYREIANGNGISENSVGSSLKRALGAVRKQIGLIPGLEREIKGLLGRTRAMVNLLVLGFL